MDIILVDGKNTTYRHGWTRQALHNSSGKPTGAIYGVLSSLIRLKNFYPQAKFVFCWDGQETWKSWRHKISKEYKANRWRGSKPPLMPTRTTYVKGSKLSEGEMPTEVKSILYQIPAIKKIVGILGIEQYESKYVEADDLIGILSRYYKKQKGVENIYIYSMDKDFYQLIDSKVSVIRDIDKSKKCKAYKAKHVLKEHGVGPKDWIKYRALIGDSSDGIKPPIKKVGKVRALKLLGAGLDPSNKEPKNKIEKQYKEQWQKIHLNYRLSKIVKDKDRLKINIAANTTVTQKKDAIKKFIAFCSEYELERILEQRHIFYSML